MGWEGQYGYEIEVIVKMKKVGGGSCCEIEKKVEGGKDVRVDVNRKK